MSLCHCNDTICLYNGQNWHLVRFLISQTHQLLLPISVQDENCILDCFSKSLIISKPHISLLAWVCIAVHLYIFQFVISQGTFPFSFGGHVIVRNVHPSVWLIWQGNRWGQVYFFQENVCLCIYNCLCIWKRHLLCIYRVNSSVLLIWRGNQDQAFLTEEKWDRGGWGQSLNSSQLQFISQYIPDNQ